MGRHSEAGIRKHQEEQIAIIRDAPVKFPSPSAVARRSSLSERVARLSLPLYTQLHVLNRVVRDVLHVATLYYAARIPRTLGRFCWRVDAKDHAVTAYERTWTDVGFPMLEAASVVEPMVTPQDGSDYRHFSRFVARGAEVPPRLRPHIDAEDPTVELLDLALIMQDLRFAQSHMLTGLRIVDVLASALRRAMNGRLQRSGWKGLGRMMPRGLRGAHWVAQLSMEDDLDLTGVPYLTTLREWDGEAKRVVLSR